MSVAMAKKHLAFFFIFFLMPLAMATLRLGDGPWPAESGNALDGPCPAKTSGTCFILNIIIVSVRLIMVALSVLTLWNRMYAFCRSQVHRPK